MSAADCPFLWVLLLAGLALLVYRWAVRLFGPTPLERWLQRAEAEGLARRRHRRAKLQR